MSQTGHEVTGEVATRDQSQHGSLRGTVEGDRVSASLRLGDLRCDVTATVSDEGHNLAGQFQCEAGEVGSLVLNRW